MSNPETKQPDQDSMIDAVFPADVDQMIVSVPVSTEPLAAFRDINAPKEWFRNVVLTDSLNSMLEKAITAIENEKPPIVSQPVQVKKQVVEIGKKKNSFEAKTEKKIGDKNGDKIEAGSTGTENSEKKKENKRKKKKSEEAIAVVVDCANEAIVDESEKKNEVGSVDVEVSEKKKKRKRKRKWKKKNSEDVIDVVDAGDDGSEKMKICKDLEDGGGRKRKLDEIGDVPLQFEEPQVEIEVDKKKKNEEVIAVVANDGNDVGGGKESEKKNEVGSVNIEVSENKNKTRWKKWKLKKKMKKKSETEDVIAVVDAGVDESEKMKFCKDLEDGDGLKRKLDEICDIPFQFEEQQVAIEVEKKSEEVIAVVANDGNDVGAGQESEKKNKDKIQAGPVDIEVSEKRKKIEEVIAAVVDGADDAGADESAKMEICKDVEDGDGSKRRLDAIDDSPIQVEEPQVEIELENNNNTEDCDVIAASVDAKNSGKTEKDNDEKIEAVSVNVDNSEKKKKRKKKKKSDAVVIVVNGANDAGAGESEKNGDKIEAGSMDTDNAEKKKSEEVFNVVDGADNAGGDEREKMNICKDEEDGKRKLGEVSGSPFQVVEPQIEVELEKKSKEDSDVIAASVDAKNSGKTEKENGEKIEANPATIENSEKKKKRKKKKKSEEAVAVVVNGANDAGAGESEKNGDKIEAGSMDTDIAEKKKSDEVIPVVDGADNAGGDEREKMNICMDEEDGKRKLDELSDSPFQVEEPKVEVELEKKKKRKKKNKEDSGVVAASVDAKNSGKTEKENDEKIETVPVTIENSEKKKKRRKKKSEEAVAVVVNGANDAGDGESEKNSDKIEAGSMDTGIAEKKKSEEVIVVVDGADNAGSDEREKMNICEDEEDADGGKRKLDEISDGPSQVEEPQVEVELEKKKRRKKKNKEDCDVIAGSVDTNSGKTEKENEDKIGAVSADTEISEKKKKKSEEAEEVIDAVVTGGNDAGVDGSEKKKKNKRKDSLEV